MKKALFAIVVVGLFGGMAFAQGGMGVEFGFDGLSSLGVTPIQLNSGHMVQNGISGAWDAYDSGSPYKAAFDEDDVFSKAMSTAGIGFTKKMNDDQLMVVRASLGYGKNTDEADPDVDGDEDLEVSSMLIGIGAGMKMYMSDGPVRTYTGGIADLTLSSGKASSGDAEFKVSGTGIAVAGILGIEYFFKDNLSLSGEYNLGLGIGGSKVETDDGTGGDDATSEAKFKAMNFGFSTIHAMITGYWGS